MDSQHMNEELIAVLKDYNERQAELERIYNKGCITYTEYMNKITDAATECKNRVFDIVWTHLRW